MMPAMYSAISGLEAHQTMLNVTANNLANVDTIGFKAQRTTFESELSQLLTGGSGQTAANGGTNPEQVGLGVQVGSIDQIMSAGSFQSTGNTLDVALQGDGFLVVGSSSSTNPVTAAGYVPTAVQSPPVAPTVINSSFAAADSLPTSYQYTRAGNLTTDSAGFLTTASGQYVMGYTTAQAGTATTPSQDQAANGAAGTATYLYIPPGSTNVSIGQDGSLTYTDNNPADTTYQQTCIAGYLALGSFPNEGGLTRDAGTDWTSSPNSGAPTFGTADNGAFGSTQVISGELEQSNVDMATEFTNMIEAERGYQANSSVISTADQMMQTLIQMAGA
jgi:flagellar hook protein FlgE